MLNSNCFYDFSKAALVTFRLNSFQGSPSSRMTNLIVEITLHNRTLRHISKPNKKSPGLKFISTTMEITLNSLSDIGLMNEAASLKILLNPKKSRLVDNKNDIFLRSLQEFHLSSCFFSPFFLAWFSSR
jgi:hypothetical protein